MIFNIKEIIMKINIKHIGFCLSLGIATAGISSCNDWLDLDPVSQITPESYYGSAAQLATYLDNYYSGQLVAPFSGTMYHAQAYNDGMARSDGNTDIMVAGLSGNTTLFANEHWEVPAGKVLQGEYGNVRIYNYFLEKATKGFEEGTIDGNAELIRNYIGEGYFFRALCYFRMLAYYGDLPIVKEVLPDKDGPIVENSRRAPRNEVARFILSDLDKAIENLLDRSRFNGQRVNKETALLFKSRVALFEATFEKYHRGSGRVPGDPNWPGAAMPYNKGKTFDINAEVDFFLSEAMESARKVADNANLTANSHEMQPSSGTVTGWNDYFEMFSRPSLANVPEALLWKEYNFDLNIKHDASYRVKIGSADGYTRTFAESFLMKDGLPRYASNAYKGDTSIDDVKTDRDERLQLFIWGESTLLDSDPTAPNRDSLFKKSNIISGTQEITCLTGYQPRKYYTYDYSQNRNDELNCTNAYPIFRSAEALLNYMEACYEKSGELDANAKKYWEALRERAGVNKNFETTINATDLSKEGDWGVYSGMNEVSPTLYNIRRERMNEFFSEGQRFADLVRWRSLDRLMTVKWIPEGVNFWDEIFKSYEDIIADGSPNANVSGKEQGKYLRPYSRNMASSNELRDGYNWHEAYYLYPIGIGDIRTASANRDLEDSNMYQNVNWPSTAGGHALK